MNLLEQYLKELYEIRSTGGGVKETSYYPPLAALLNEIGKTLTPKVKCVCQLKNTGAGNPDFGLFTASQFRKSKDAEPLSGQTPERGVIEAKSTDDDSWLRAEGAQVSKYHRRYSQVLVTNYHDFVFVGTDANGTPQKLETFRLAGSEAAFWELAQHPRKADGVLGERFVEYLSRVMQYSAALKNPQDLAWFLASYAREARMRIESAGDLPGLAMLRKGLEDALGLKFEADKGEHFFRSTLIQTLFYGIFSSWVLWARNNKGGKHGTFNWHEAAWNLHVPMIASLFEQIATPKQLKPLEIDEVLDWAGAALNRVDRGEFFRQFEEAHAVQYFYEPFLEAYDPALRKELGVWYTPPEIVKYQVERVDTVLREELGIADGLADEHVVVLDPCCGTGAYLVEVLKKIHRTLEGKGGDALTGAQLKKAAMGRVFGFEILPAPFVIAHLQLGLLLRELGAPLSDRRNERAGVYLTNALTGWEPPKKPKDKLPFLELQEEKDAAEKVKREAPILVILGNPPYNAFAGTSPEEEGGLVDAYKEGLNKPIKEGGWGIKKFNLDDLYIRFFRIAERRIVRGGKGVVSYISNFSYLDDPSFVVMRKNFLSEFDTLWFDCMNGDSRETGKQTPDGKPDPSVFSTEYNKAGIRVGTTICLMARKTKRDKIPVVRFQHFWGATKRADLLESLKNKQINRRYKKSLPAAENRYSFRPGDVAEHYLEWPKVSDFCAVPPTNGLMEKRGGALIDIDRDALRQRMQVYCDKMIFWEEYKNYRYGLEKDRAAINPKHLRERVLKEEVFQEESIIRYALRPYDTQWAYYSITPGVWNRNRPQYWSNCFEGNSFFMTRVYTNKTPEGAPCYWVKGLSDDHFMSPDNACFPIWIKVDKPKSKDDDGMTGSMFGGEEANESIKANLSDKARGYLRALGFGDPDAHRDAAEVMWMHSLAIGYSGAYLRENADGIRQDWPRIPLPDSKKALSASAGLGRQVAALLDTEAGVAGVTTSAIRGEFGCIGLVSRVGGGAVNPDAGELEVTAGWGHAGKGGVCMPGKGKAVVRPWSAEEMRALSAEQRGLLGGQTCDVYLNERVFIKNVPSAVWDFTIGGYQVVKKWLSYRERSMLGRGLTMEEALYIREMVRRLSALVMLGPELDANYAAVIAATTAL